MIALALAMVYCVAYIPMVTFARKAVLGAWVYIAFFAVGAEAFYPFFCFGAFLEFYFLPFPSENSELLMQWDRIWNNSWGSKGT